MATNRNGITFLAGFKESLRLLVMEEEYSLTDIAQMFGVSRERIRQLCAQYDIPNTADGKGLRAIRVWNDATHRFVPVKRHIITTRNRHQRTQARQERLQKNRENRRTRIVAAVRELQRELGRDPQPKEIYERVFNRTAPPVAVIFLISPWKYRGKTTAEGHAAMYAECGLTRVGVGGHWKLKST